MAALLREVASADCAEVGGSLSLKNPTPSVGYAAGFSLRLGHAAALTVHRTVIHYRADTSLPQRRSPRSKIIFADTLTVHTVC